MLYQIIFILKHKILWLDLGTLLPIIEESDNQEGNANKKTKSHAKEGLLSIEQLQNILEENNNAPSEEQSDPNCMKNKQLFKKRSYITILFFSVQYLVFQNNSESRLSSSKVFNSLNNIVHFVNLDPRLDAVSSSKFKHFFNFLRRTDSRATDMSLVQNKDNRVKFREIPIRHTDVDEVTVSMQETQISVPYINPFSILLLVFCLKLTVKVLTGTGTKNMCH